MSEYKPDAITRRLLSLLDTRFVPTIYREDSMSLLIEGRHEPAARADLRRLLSDLLGAHAAALRSDPAPDGFTSDAVRNLYDVVQRVYRALTDLPLTEYEMDEMGVH